ncbi:3 beta-hydroxysteroid dehydrogenase type 7-like [Leucoraja erinacea]|uniref:3 beta-hydroxysteroid dehydrogenase type 7-like n=1 Tax=Leucoraja erinaceus TaxID=7782 RepID=UPI002457CC9D|nr:3 beta-hydroxysteroid dehydrogenase type 7-like [Leucoraja erinacea]
MTAGADSESGRDAGRAGLVYLLTGGSGFVGRHLARMLAEREPDLKELRVLDITLDPELHSLNSGEPGLGERDTDRHRGRGTERERGARESQTERSGDSEKLERKIERERERERTGVYGEGNPIMENLYRTVMRFGGKRLRLADKDIEHGRVYVGNVAWMHLLAARALRQNPGLVGGEAYFCYDESPYLSYEDFDQLLLGSAGVRLVGREPVLPFGLLYLLALTFETLQWILRPIAKFEAAFNRCTLTIVTTAFSVSTNKAARHLGYATLVPWHQCQARTVAWVKSLAQTGPGRGPAI